MKQLTCEMCGGTDLVKQDGVFVCQSCGCKYSVEEAKKMMVEVQGEVQVKNMAQMENLLNLARSSFESKNYAQAEEFCNQVIAIDDKNYDAWKLKGEAINYQITAKNPRILEVYNCIMTSYRILPEEEKETKKYEILSSLKTCFEGEIDFWIKQFEAGRPTDAALKKVEDSFTDSRSKMKAAFEELGFEETKQGYLKNFDNYFCKLCNSICVSAWKSTVGYNYYRDDFKNLGANWKWDSYVYPNTYAYRPTRKIYETFKTETINLVNLLEYAERRFNDETPLATKENIYSNISYFSERMTKAVSFKIETGYENALAALGGVTNKSVGWKGEYRLSDSAIEYWNKKKAKYNEKEEAVKQERVKREQEEKERKRAEYWEQHAEEKAKLDEEKKSLQEQIAQLNQEIADIPGGTEKEEIQGRISSLLQEKEALGLFKLKEKKEVQGKIDAAQAELKAVTDRMDAAEQAIKEKISPLQKRINEIDTELTKDR